MAAGNVALVGDAAHPMLPFLGQGGVLRARGLGRARPRRRGGRRPRVRAGRLRRRPRTAREGPGQGIPPGGQDRAGAQRRGAVPAERNAERGSVGDQDPPARQGHRGLGRWATASGRPSSICCAAATPRSTAAGHSTSTSDSKPTGRASGARYTRTRLPVEVAAVFEMPDESSARREEARIKALSRDREARAD